ncbi:PD-(D/E)XK nuclease domain-containing protein [Cylindrospermopsis raciborskii CS-506_B]|nr:PD-(D/E)XK nuclease domain-containing protein [Cylindrospermopsis raciborskii CS-506_B]
MVGGNQVQGNPALDQILQRNYAEKYRGEPGKSVHEIGLIFSRSQRNLIQADWQ